jgi:hypothetical protein
MFISRMDGHIHAGVMSGLLVIGWVVIFHFLARTWSGLKSDNPALKGLAYVA